ncbi:DsbA family protein [Enemella dayhoffiae]|nr:thioredoxin domain-containing protein [Enemella dayhoffiae]
MSKKKSKSQAPQNARQRAAILEARRRKKAAVQRNVIISAAVMAVAALVIGLVVGIGSMAREQEAAGGPAGQLVRADSVHLNRVENAPVTVVEFLDFECPACAALYPTMEQTRATYGDRVNFVMRYFPLPGHQNAMAAARAVEAAGQQGQWEAMYRKMFETQNQWAGRPGVDALFRGYAAELGLDVTAWEAAYNDPATTDRIEADQADGEALGVTGTPTVYVNGDELQLRSYADLPAAIEDALAA